MNLYRFPIFKNENIIEIGSGFGDLAKSFEAKGYLFLCLIEPDQEKYKFLHSLFDKRTLIIDESLTSKNIKTILFKYSSLTIIMQDVIEHIPPHDFFKFICDLKSKNIKIRLIGRTPNLTSPFGLRNSFGDNTHILRFNNISLENYLKKAGFSEIHIKAEPYRVTGIVSFLRFLPYYFVLTLFFLAFLCIYGFPVKELTPNIVFEAKI
jgi:hypothetical protein